jgi:hypothetical protein
MEFDADRFELCFSEVFVAETVTSQYWCRTNSTSSVSGAFSRKFTMRSVALFGLDRAFAYDPSSLHY